MSDSPQGHSAKKPLATEKRCIRCELNKPLDDFLEAPDFPAGQYRKELCIPCAAKAYYQNHTGESDHWTGQRAKERQKDRAEVRQMLEKFVAKASGPRSSLPHICEMGEAIYTVARERYGRDGNLHVAHELWDAMEASKKDNPSGIALQRYFQLLLQVVKVGTEHKASKPLSEHFDEEEVRARFLELIKPGLTDQWLTEVVQERKLRIFVPEAS